MSPFGFIDDGLMGRDQFVDGGEVWSKVDEYGTTAGGWELEGTRTGGRGRGITPSDTSKSRLRKLLNRSAEVIGDILKDVFAK